MIFSATTDAAAPTPTTVSVSNVMVRVGAKKVKCDFVLVFLYDTVDIRSSSMSCPRGFGGQTASVEITSSEGYKFSGVVKPPRKIMSMSGGDIFGGFMANVNLETDPIVESGCGGYGAEVFGNESTRVFLTNTSMSHFYQNSN